MLDPKNIFLIGPMGAGKSSVGKLLAKTLGYEFFDSDQEIESQTGANIPWIFDIEGELGFRQREAKVVDDLTQKQHIVLATGGGVILNEANRINLASRGSVVYLKVSIEEQVRRTYRSRNRPLIVNKNAREIFERLKAERESYYLEIADYIVDTDHGSIRVIVDSILEQMKLIPSNE